MAIINLEHTPYTVKCPQCYTPIGPHSFCSQCEWISPTFSTANSVAILTLIKERNKYKEKCELLSELSELREERTKRLHLEIKRLREGYDRIRGLAAGIKIAGHETLADGLVELVDEILEEE